VLVIEERKETREESIWPADFAENEKDDLDEDEDTIEDSPEGSSRGIGDSRAPVPQAGSVSNRIRRLR